MWEWGKPVGNLWRTTGDISDNWTSMIGKAQFNRNLPQYAGPGHWNDPDMLEVGNGGMTATEYRTHFSLWAVMAAPLLIGSDLRRVNEDTFTILKNTDVIAVDQDRLGRQATVISATGGLVVYSKVLSNGDRAVALSNETTATATIGTTASAIGLGGSASYTLKDLWSKATRTTTGAISASVPAHGTVLYRVSRAGTATRYEAEAGTITSGVVESNHSGFSGSGFVNFNNAVGSAVQWTVNAAEAGSATLVFDYANGTTVNRPLNITVNGGAPAALSFPGTGAWSLWKTSHVTVNLNAGANTIRATATTADGGPNLDHLDVVTGAGSPQPPTTTVEAEAGTVAGAARVGACAACSGGQKVGFIGNGAANHLTLAVNAATAGAKTVTVQYLLSGSRSFFVSVNGGAAQQVALTGTSWATPVTTTITVNLNAGANTIRFFNDTAYAPDLDRITL